MIYLDNAATTRCDPEVIAAIVPYFSKDYGNASNTAHQMGTDAFEAVRKARNQVSSFLYCLPKNIIWTSGATESNNLAIQGVLREMMQHEPRRPIHLVTSSIEHKSVLELMQALALFPNITISYVQPDNNGKLDTRQIIRSIKENTVLVSIMLANNEIGVVNDLREVVDFCQAKNITTHTDATQYVGKRELNLNVSGFDLVCFSGHKLNAQKGIGGLYVKDPSKLIPLFFGGGQEYGIRSGTLNVPGIVGLGCACRLLSENLEAEITAITALRDLFEERMLSFGFPILINGYGADRLPHISSISFAVQPGVNLIDLVGQKQFICCSSGAACDTPDNKPSHVMLQMGKSRHEAKNTLRFSFGRFNSADEVNAAAEHMANILMGM